MRALTRVAEADTEADLLELALEATASQTERTVPQWRRADALDEESIAVREEFDHWWDQDGMLVRNVRMDAERGAALLAAVNSLAERAARRDRAAAARAARRELTARSSPSRGVSPTKVHRAAQAPDEEVDEPALARERTTARRLAALAALAEAAADADRRPGDPPRREAVLHVDAALIAEDAAAGRAYLDGGPASSPARARRLMCEATVVTMLENDREPLAVGRRRRRATRAQRLALLRRDGGCARPGCTEHRIERLHAHHMRHWLYGGRTDLANLVLLCDTDHGLAHDLELVMTRRDGRLIALTGDGTRIWGPADTAFSAGIPPRPAPTAPADPAGSAGRTATAAARPVASWGGGASTPGGSGEPEVLDGSNQWESPDERESPDEQGDGFAGVHPHRHGSRPAPGDAPVRHRSRRWHPSGRCPRDPRTAPTPPGAFTTPSRSPSPATTPSPGMTAAPPASRTIGDLLFPHGEPSLPEALHVNGERMDLGYVVGVLMGNRDLVRRLAAETGAAPVAA